MNLNDHGEATWAYPLIEKEADRWARNNPNASQHQRDERVSQMKDWLRDEIVNHWLKYGEAWADLLGHDFQQWYDENSVQIKREAVYEAAVNDYGRDHHFDESELDRFITIEMNDNSPTYETHSSLAGARMSIGMDIENGCIPVGVVDLDTGDYYCCSFQTSVDLECSGQYA